MGKSKFHLKLKKSQVIRHLIQLAAFLLTPGLFISAFGAVKDVYTAILGGTFSLGALSYQLLLLAAVVPVTVLLGRFFCGYFCSFGALGDAVWFVAGKIHKKRLDIGKRADRILKLLKYAVLAFLVVLIWTLGLVRFDSVDSPWTIFGMFASFSGWPSASFLLTSGAALLLLIIAGSALIERFFCRYLCPLGAIFSILSLPRLFRVSKPRAACGPCTLCMKKCAMGIALNEADTVASGECINCFKCVDACPRCNVRANPAPAVATALATAAIAGLAYAGSLTAEAGLEAQSATISDNAAATVSGPIAILAPGTYSVAASASTAASGASASVTPAAGSAQTGAAAPTASSSTPIATGAFEDGVYTGSGTGFRGTTKVSVTVSGGQITAVQVVSYKDDSQYFSRAKGVISSILGKQSVNISAVSGATFSSNSILEAVANALGIDFKSPNAALPVRR